MLLTDLRSAAGAAFTERRLPARGASRVNVDVLAAPAELGPGSLVILRRDAQAVMSPANILFSAGGLVAVAGGGGRGHHKVPEQLFQSANKPGEQNPEILSGSRRCLLVKPERSRR